VEGLHGDSSLVVRLLAWVADRCPQPIRSKPLQGVWDILLGLLVFDLVGGQEILALLVYLFLSQHPLTDQLLRVEEKGGGMLLDELVGQRLCDLRILFVRVTMASEAHNVDHDIFLESLPVLHSELAGRDDSVDIVPIDMDDGSLDQLGNIGAVIRGPCEVGVGSEADLIVDDDMDRPSDSVVGEIRELRERHGDQDGDR
jgi:hypothetical protein